MPDTVPESSDVEAAPAPETGAVGATDAEAVRRVRAGDREAFAELAGRYAGPLAALAYDRLGTAADAQDAAQDTLAIAYERLETLREPTRFGAWVYEILRNRCALRQRRRGVARKHLERLADARAGTAHFTPLDRLVAVERDREIRAAVEALTPPLREAVVLRYIGGANREQAASVLGVSLDALDKRVERALRTLREVLRET